MKEKNPKACRHLTRQGVPCKNRVLWKSEYCFVHSASQSRSWGFYLGIIGSIASIIGLVFLFLPNHRKASLLSKRVPFFITSLNDVNSPVDSVFDGTYRVYDDHIEVSLDSVTFEPKHTDAQKVLIGFINGGLAIRSDDGHWRIIHQGGTDVKLSLNATCTSHLGTNITFRIPYPPNTDLGPYHLVLGPAIQTETNTFVTEAGWWAHGGADMFSRIGVINKDN